MRVLLIVSISLRTCPLALSVLKLYGCAMMLPLTCSEEALKCAAISQNLRLKPMCCCHAQVSIARSGATCSALPAAVLALVHNFTAAQSMQESLPLASSVLDAHAKDTKEHFELARSLFRKVGMCSAWIHARVQGEPRQYVSG